MEERVARLELDMRDVKSVLSRLEPMIIRIDATLTSTLPHLATRAEVSKEISVLRIEMNQNLSEMNHKLSDTNLKLSGLPTKTYMWGVLAVLIAAYGAGLAALAVIK
jgi:transcriptional antiterminator